MLAPSDPVSSARLVAASAGASSCGIEVRRLCENRALEAATGKRARIDDTVEQRPTVAHSRFSRLASALKVVLLEGVHESAVESLRKGGFEHIEQHARALEGERLLEAVRGAHYIGIRLRTQL